MKIRDVILFDVSLFTIVCYCTIFFQMRCNALNIIKSYILRKIIYGSERFIVAMGSKNSKKFTKDQQVDLVEYLIQVIQIKLIDIN